MKFPVCGTGLLLWMLALPLGAVERLQLDTEHRGVSEQLESAPAAILAVAARKTEPLPLAAPYVMRGYLFASSPVPDSSALGGFARSSNLPLVLDRAVPPNAISLLALPEEPLDFEGHRGFRVILANSTARPLRLSASDSRLSIIREALDEDGEWKPIEYLPRSWCGNSYHHVTLPSEHYWSFVAPVYEGPHPVQMRFVLDRGPLRTKVYSNNFTGFIYREQFSVKRLHAPSSIMDPYED